jgi:hypothetical protein
VSPLLEMRVDGMRAIAQYMGMPELALAFLAVYGLLAFGVRIAVHVRRTGSTGFKGLRGATGLEPAGGLLLVSALVLCVAGPALQLAGVLDPLAALSGDVANIPESCSPV